MKKPIDENMIAKVTESENGIDYYDVRQEPFSLCGVWYDADGFYRIPVSVAEKVSKGIYDMRDFTAGGRVRFSTDSDKIYLKATFRNAEEVTCMTSISVKGFDLYADGIFSGVFTPPYGKNEGDIKTYVNLSEKKEREITVHFPLYAGVSELYIGVAEGSSVRPAKPYKYETPIVFYGSSITNGAASSRPGMTYEAILSRMLSADHRNLGYGGCAKGEEAMAEYIASLPSSVFVLDYDFNAPTVEHLAATHEPMYLNIRATHPDIPVIFITRPGFRYNADEVARRNIVLKTYEGAKARGENVYFVDGETIFGIFGGDGGSVDGCHPNDLGFACVAAALDPIFAEIYGKM